MLLRKLFIVICASLLAVACSGGNNKLNSGSSVMESTEPGTPGDFKVNIGDTVHYEYDSSEVSSEGKVLLSRQATWLKEYANKSIIIEGYADERGTREYNIALGNRRAENHKKFLVSKGVASSRIQTMSYGKDRPAVEGDDESAFKQNRRSVTVIQN